MKRLAWSIALVLVGVIAATDSACTVVLNNGDDASTPGDSSTESGSSGGSSGSSSGGSDTGSPSEASADTGGQSDSGATADADGGMCPVGIDTMVPACNQCIESMCCAQWVTCTMADDAGIDEAGQSQCVQLAECVLAWVADDAGTSSSGEAACGASYSQSERDTAHAFLTCKQGSCSTQCP